jgi:lactate racemase
MHFTYGFGKGIKEFDLEAQNILMELLPNEVNTTLTGIEEVRRALQNPIGTECLSRLVNPGEKVVIITSDITRPMPSKLVLPALLEELNLGGVRDEDIMILFALGSHRKHTEEEKKYLVGEETFKRVKCIDSDPGDCMHLGTTNSGTPVDIFRPAAEADRRICLGNIEFHYFAGYSGGAKAMMPGVSTRDAIQANHRLMVEQAARAGAMEDNPVRQDMEEVTQFISIDFILNVVLDEKKNIINVVAGHHVKAHREGCRFLDSLYKVEIPRQADIVITSPGGYPKDINLYQAQKALDNAKHAVKAGGIIILVAACTEGLGEEVFERWIHQSRTPEKMIADIQKHFELGGHKAAAIALVREKAEIFLVSEMDAELSHKIFMKPFLEVQEALEKAFEQLGRAASVLLMPYGGSTLPFISKK